MSLATNVIKFSWNLALTLLLCLSPALAAAHCDTLNGPVTTDGRLALEKNDVTPALKWVTSEHEAEVKDIFAVAATVRQTDGAAGQLAERYFLENLVRLHRAGEGAPYTGLHPDDTVDHAVAMTDQALVDKSIDHLVEKMTKALANGLHQRFNHAVSAKEKSEQSVNDGRQYVAAYVELVHHVEKLHQALKGAAHCADHEPTPDAKPTACPSHKH